MNLNIVWDKKYDIENYNNVHISENDYIEKIKQIPDAGCKSIHITEQVYMLPHTEVMDLILLSCQKLRMKGRISVSTFNFDLIAADYLAGKLESKNLSNYLSIMRSNVRYDEISKIFYQTKIVLQSVDSAEYYQILHGSR